MRIFFSADVHGSSAIWKKWVNAAKFYHADVLMLCGDLTGKGLIPLIEQGDGSYIVHYFKKYKLKGEKEIRKIEEKISASGFYTKRCTKDEVEEMQGDRAKANEAIKEAMKERMKQWLEILVKKVDTKNVTAIVMPGNDDEPEIDPIIKLYEADGVIYPIGKVVDIGGFETISLPDVNPTPWNTPREATEGELKKKCDKLIKKLSDPRRAIFNFHCPPYNTMLDLAPELDGNLKQVIIAGQPQMRHVGSKSIREAIEENHPLIGLHGHVHESPGADKVGNAPVINPGSEYERGILRGFIVNMTKEGVTNYWKVEG